jgi:AraC-like DNA-binding protein
MSALCVMRKGSRPKLWLTVLMATVLTYILIAEAKELISDDNSLTIVEIAEKVGFKSVT